MAAVLGNRGRKTSVLIYCICGIVSRGKPGWKCEKMKEKQSHQLIAQLQLSSSLSLRPGIDKAEAPCWASAAPWTSKYM